MSPAQPATDWQIDYDDPGPIRIRDPVAEVLGVLPEGEPFSIDYRDVVKHAGHSCPAASGAYRITKAGLDALYPDSLPVRSDVAVTAAGGEEQHPYGVISGIISHITGASDIRGFHGLGDGFGDRQGLLSFDGFDADDVAFEFRREDTNEAVRVTYHLSAVSRPEGLGNLGAVLEGEADENEVAAFRSAWHERVQEVLDGGDLFTVEAVA